MSEQTPLTWLAPAKLNLFLHVVSKRPDGYHGLQTAFVFLDYHDELRFELNDNDVVKRIDKQQVCLSVTENSSLPDQDLCVQAAQALQAYASVEQGVTIELRKRIPMGTGLGGGSSDAATCLIALNELWGCGLSRQQLAQIGLKLGADVPVFVHGFAAWAEGLGEQLSPINPQITWVCVLIPQIHVSTAEIFSNSALTLTPAITKIRGCFSPGLRNDLEPVTCALYPQVGKALVWLNHYGEARMSGSGASVFLGCDSQQQAKAILDDWLQSDQQGTGFVARSLNAHPHL